MPARNDREVVEQEQPLHQLRVLGVPCVVICSIVVAECYAAKVESVSAAEGFDLFLSELGLAFNRELSSLILWLSIHFYGPSKNPLKRQ